MPIRPENRHRYPPEWNAIRADVRARSGDRCERCDVPNRAYRITYEDGSEYAIEPNETDARGRPAFSADRMLYIETAELADDAHVARIVLTVAHLNHQPEDNRPENLAHLCQRCHNRHDAATRARGIRERRAKPLIDAIDSDGRPPHAGDPHAVHAGDAVAPPVVSGSNFH